MRKPCSPAVWRSTICGLSLMALLAGCAGHAARPHSLAPLPGSSSHGQPPAGAWQTQLPPLPQDSPAPADAAPRTGQGIFNGVAGDDCFDKSATASVPQPGELALTSSAGQVSYAIYRFPADTQTLVQGADVSLVQRSPADSPLYLAVADYALGHWRFAAASLGDGTSVKFSTTAGDCTSPGGSCYVLALVFDGAAATLSRLSLETGWQLDPPGSWSQDAGGKYRWGLANASIVDQPSLAWVAAVPAAASGVPGQLVMGPDGAIVLPAPVASGSSSVRNADGSLRLTLASGPGTSATPAVGADGRIYCPGADHYLRVFNPDGSLSYQALCPGGAIVDFALDHDGRAYVDNYANLIAFDPEGRVRWKTEDGQDCAGLALGAEGTIFKVDKWGQLDAFNSDGALEWQAPLHGTAATGPVLALNGTSVYTACSGHMLQFDLAGAPLAHYDDDTLGAAVALATTASVQLVAVCIDQNNRRTLRLFDAACQPLKSLDLPAQLGTQLIVDHDGHIILLSGTDSITVFHSDLFPLWNYSVAGATFSSAAVGPTGQLYVYDTTGRLYCLAAPDSVPLAPAGLTATDGTLVGMVSLSWTPAAQAAGYQIWRDGVQVATVGAVAHWDDLAVAPGQTYSYSLTATNALGASPPSLPDNGSAAAPGTPGSYWATPDADAANSGTVGASGPHTAGTLEAVHGEVDEVLTTTDGSLVALEPTGAGGGLERVVKLSATGAELWHYDLDTPYPQPAVLSADGACCLTLGDGSVLLLGPDGRLRWRQPLWTGQHDGWLSTPACAPDGLIYLYACRGVYPSPGREVTELHALALEATTGTLVWDRLLSSVPGGGYNQLAPVAGSDSHVYLPAGGGQGLLALDTDGAVLAWIAPEEYLQFAPSLARDSLNGDRLFLVHTLPGTDSQVLSCYRPDGTPVWRTTETIRVAGTAALSPLGPAIVYGGDGVCAFDRTDGHLLWQNAGDWWDGVKTWAPLVDGAGYTYIGVDPEASNPGSPGGPPFVAPNFTCVAPDGSTAWQLPGTHTFNLALSPSGDLYFALNTGLAVIRH